jgi:hypothetical protein
MVSQASPGTWALDLKQLRTALLRRRLHCAILVRVSSALRLGRSTGARLGECRRAPSNSSANDPRRIRNMSDADDQSDTFLKTQSGFAVIVMTLVSGSALQSSDRIGFGLAGYFVCVQKRLAG